MTYVLGLTGSIGMGKSTLAQMFRDEGVPVWDADATVAKLYAPGGAATLIVAETFPDVMDGPAVSRAKLRDRIAKDAKVLDQLQSLVHPLVAEDRMDFLNSQDAAVVVLDVPLLFETGTDARCDGIVVVTAPADVQKERVMARGEMTEDDFNLILSRQMPDAEKRSKATWVVETLTMDAARQSVRDILDEIAKDEMNA